MILAFGGVVIVGAARRDRRSRRSRAGAAARVRPDLAFTRGQQALAMLHPIARGMQQGQTVLRRPRTARLGAGRGPGLLGGADRRHLRGARRRRHPPDDRAAGLVFLVSTLVQLFPFWPGNVGLFQAAVAQVLVQAYPIDFPHAIAFAVGLQVIEVSLGVGLGFWFLSREGLSLSEVRGLRARRLTAQLLRPRPEAIRAFVGGTSPRAGESAPYTSVDMQRRWDGSPRPAARCRDVARARASRASRRCRPTPRGARPVRRRRHPSRAPSCARPPVPFRWHTAKRARGYDLRVARDRRFRTQMQTVHVRASGAHLLLLPGPLVLEGALHGQGQLALVEHPRRSSCARRATPIRPRARRRCA